MDSVRTPFKRYNLRDKIKIFLQGYKYKNEIRPLIFTFYLI